MSRHNLKYWQGGEYIGFGPDASSDFGGHRFSIIRDLVGYIDGIRKSGSVLREDQIIAPRERAGEYLMMRLRTVGGVIPEEYEQRFLLPFGPLAEKLAEYADKGYAIRTYDGRWHLTAEGFLISNAIISDLLMLQDQTENL